MKWLNWGDKNSKFFHASTIQRRDRNRLERIRDTNCSWVEGQQSIFKAVMDHYSGVYQSEGCQGMNSCLQVVPKLINDDMNYLLTRPVDDEEIRGAVFSLGALKAPGSDGLNGLFFQKNWETLRVDVCNVVQAFFNMGFIPPEINETLVTLTPKVPLPESINHLRPISCCNFIYKILSKILVMRLKKFMGHIISPNQSTFVGGRMIQDNLAIAHEIFHALKKEIREERSGLP